LTDNASGQTRSTATSGARRTADLFWYTPPEGNASVQLSTGSGFGIQGNWITGWGAPDWLGVGDFNGDGKDDFIWYEGWHNAGASVVFSTGSGFVSQGQWFTGFSLADWAGVGDFNGDGKADVLWYETWNNAGASILLSHGSGFNLGGQWLTGLARPLWAGVGDFNGDGLDDLIWYQDDARAYVYFSTGNGFVAQGAWLWGWAPPDFAGVGDFNGDGKDDLLWYEGWNNAGGSIVFSRGTSFEPVGQWFTGFSRPDWAAVADVNGDGKADLLWYENWNNAGISVLLSFGNGFDLGGQWATKFPIPTRAAVGNFDGDTKFIGGCASWDAASPRLPPTGQYYTFAAPDVWAVLRDYDVAHVLSSVQAIANASAPRLFMLDQWGMHRRWLNELRQPGQPLAGYTETPLATLPDVVNTFRSSIDGAVVWGEDCWATRNAAVTAAGADGRRLIVLRKDPDPNSVYTLMTKPTSQGGLGIPVLIDLTNKFTGSGTIWDTSPALPSTGSKKDDVYHWMIQKYVQTSKANPNLLAYRIDGYWIYKTQTVGQSDLGSVYDNDYLISRKAIVFDLDPWNDEIPADDWTQPLGSDFNTLRYLYQEAYNRSDQSKLLKTIGYPPFTLKYSATSPTGPTGIKNNHGDVATEWRGVRIASTYNSYLETDIEGTANTSFYAWMPRTVNRQAAPSGESKNYLYAKGYLSRITGLVNKKYILLTESDFDAVSWMQGFLVKGSPPVGNEGSFWEDPSRGVLPIAWAFNPQMVDRVPNIFNYLYCSRANNDYFVGGDSGAGYVNPTYLLGTQKGNLPGGAAQVADGVTPWVAHNQKYYRLLDYSITNNIINGEAGELSQPEVLNRLRDFSPDGTTLLATWPPATMWNGMPLVGSAAGVDRDPQNIPVNGIRDRARDVMHEANAIKNALADNTKMFYQFRVVLVPPNELVDAVNQAKITYPALEAVDPYTFFDLMKIRLGLDIVPPACNFQINGGAAITTSRTVQIGPIVNAFDYRPNNTGIRRLRFSNDRIVWQEFTPGQSIWFTLTGGAGLKTVYMQAQDGAGNWGNSDSPDNYAKVTITYSP
jgi:hypothetical protein